MGQMVRQIDNANETDHRRFFWDFTADSKRNRGVLGQSSAENYQVPNIRAINQATNLIGDGKSACRQNFQNPMMTQKLSREEDRCGSFVIIVFLMRV